jgi:hypothetical protein
LLTLRLFFLLPNKPCRIKIGAPFAFPCSSWRVYARSTVLQGADAWNERAHVGSCTGDIRVGCFGCMGGEQIGCRLRHSERMVAVVLQKIFGHLRNISECAPRHLYLPRPFWNSFPKTMPISYLIWKTKGRNKSGLSCRTFRSGSLLWWCRVSCAQVSRSGGLSPCILRGHGG